MASFKIALEITGLNEGGYTDDISDSGNWTSGKVGIGKLIGTKYGISAPVLCDYLKREATVSDMMGLIRDVSDNIYEKNYWNKMRGDEIIIQNEANSLYDSCVNMGCSQAIKLAQSALGLTGKNITGTMTNDTLNLLNNKK